MLRDTWFRVEVDDWVYLLVTASLHRMLDGRWRRSGLPLLFARHPVETCSPRCSRHSHRRVRRTAKDDQTDQTSFLCCSTRPRFGALLPQPVQENRARPRDWGDDPSAEAQENTQSSDTSPAQAGSLADALHIPVVNQNVVGQDGALLGRAGFCSVLEAAVLCDFVECLLNEAIYGWPADLGASWWYGMTSAVLQGPSYRTCCGPMPASLEAFPCLRMTG